MQSSIASKASAAQSPSHSPTESKMSTEASPDRRGKARIRPETLATIGVFGLTIILIFLSRFVSPALGSWSEVNTIVILASFLIVVAFGQGLVILLGGLDLSIPALITIGGVLTTTWIGTSGGATWLLFPVILSICACIGAISGAGIALLGIPPFIMTMASGIIVASSALGYTAGSPRGAAPAVLLALMKSQVLGVSWVVIFTLMLAALGAVIQGRTAFGRRLMAIGSNARAAILAGVPTRTYTILAYAASSLTAGLAGMMLVGYASGATLRMGDAYLLPSIAAVVVGGSSILGGRGSFVSTIGGALLLTTLGIVIAALGVRQGWRTVIEGCTILIALLLLRENFFVFLGRLSARK
jgi:ribose transport system permease protein